jgi:hypothetical protein
VLTNYLTQLVSSSISTSTSNSGGGGLGSLIASLFTSNSKSTSTAVATNTVAGSATYSPDLLTNYFTFHRGGVVGENRASRQAPASVFASVMRLHEGGVIAGDSSSSSGGGTAAPGTAPVAPVLMPGLAVHEVPAILLGGPPGIREEVLRADDPRHADNLPGGSFERFMAQLTGVADSGIRNFRITGFDAPVAAHAFHIGGLVGHGGISIALPAATWAGAERYHDGGIVGLLERGQMSPAVSGGAPGASNEVRRADAPADWRHGGTTVGMDAKQAPLQVFVQQPPNGSRDSAMQAGVQIGQGIQRAMRRKGG